jgi:ArsR family transcriptional regulator, cadmium/lead-responsive transcriptional repressor
LPDPGPIYAALADATRRTMVDTLLRDGTTSVPALTSELPITRQAVAKHLATLDEAGLVERVPQTAGREVQYRLADGWDARLQRLKRAVE